MIRLGFNCSECMGQCENFANNLLYTYYQQWLSKVEIINDPKNLLIDIFDNLNLVRMIKGIVPVIIDYGIGLTIGNNGNYKYDKNGIPIYADVQVNLNATNNIALDNNNNNGINLHVIDWKLSKKENKEKLSSILKNLGFNSVEIIENENSERLILKSDIPIYFGFFFRNNLTNTPSLQNLNKIIWNIHNLDKINNRNQKLINLIYFGKTGKKLTPEQANNISITITKDGYGAVIAEKDGSDTILTETLQKNINTQTINNWANIKNELEYWTSQFHIYAGIGAEKLSNQRENVAESILRTARVSATEKDYYKYIKRFFDEYNEYFNTKLEYQFDTLIEQIISHSKQQLTIDNTPIINKIKVNEKANEGKNENEI